MTKTNQKTVRYTLGVLLALIALNAFAGGYYGLAGAGGVPTEWLAGSPFKTYIVPSIILGAVVGGSCLLAAVVLFKNTPVAKTAGLFSGTVLLTWIVVQLVVIGYVSWMQPATFLAAFIVLLLACILQRKTPGT